jgi:protein-S-isoprenylcysteine O-methyltransferase Ste14
MNASALGFRFRSLIFVVVVLLGFTAPWNWALHLDGTGPNSHVWGQLAVLLSRGGAMSISAAFNLVLAVGIVCALAGAWLRTWGAAYLGVDVVQDPTLRADAVVAQGPYAYLRNPLYVGGWLGLLALAMLMPVSGAVFVLAVMGGLMVHTILREEAHLRGQLGAPYAEHCARVPRLVPTLRRRGAAEPGTVSPGTISPHWGRAAAAEIFMWGVAASFAALGWRYDAHLLIQCVLVWFGVGLVVRGLLAKPSGSGN